MAEGEGAAFYENFVVDVMEGGVDNDLFSRAIAAYGLEALKRIQSTKVLIVGLNGVGAEIAKNVILTGVDEVMFYGVEAASPSDLSSQFYLNKDDLGADRAGACLDRFKELNSYVTVTAADGQKLDESFLPNFSIVIIADPMSFTIEQLSVIGDICHNSGTDDRPATAFVVAGTMGLHGYMFSDFGPAHVITDAVGDNKKLEVMCICATLDKEAGTTTVVIEPDPLYINQFKKFKVGSVVAFRNAKNMPVVQGGTFKVTSKSSVFATIEAVTMGEDGVESSAPLTEADFGETHAQSGSAWMEVLNKSETKSYSSFRESFPALSDAEGCVMNDFRKFSFGAQHMHGFLQAAFAFKEEHRRLPTPGCDDDAEVMLAKVTEAMKDVTKWGAPAFTEDQHESVRRMSKTAAGSLSATASIVGGFVAQEVTKLSGKYTPCDQWSHFEFLEVLPDVMPTKEDCAPTNSRYDGQIAVFGKEFQQKVQSLKTFLVGCGALGCEIAKGLCMVGAGTSEEGLITITDMDTIERSNLSRQFLFRPGDIDAPKSKATERAMREMNPDVNVKCFTDPVMNQTEHIFTEQVWSSQELLINALDNESARHYVDEKAVWYNTPLLESATTGVQGSFKSIIPGQTESIRDHAIMNDDSVIPMCTLKGAPYEGTHCIEWAIHEETDGSLNKLFKLLPTGLKQYLEDSNKFLDTMDIENANETDYSGFKEKLDFILHALELGDVDASFGKCVEWARNTFDKLFYHDPAAKLHLFPADYVRKVDGQPFYNAKVRLPQVQRFDSTNQEHVWFVYAAANMRATTLGVPVRRIVNETSCNEFLALANQVAELEFVPPGGVADDADPDDVVSEYPASDCGCNTHSDCSIIHLPQDHHPVCLGQKPAGNATKEDIIALIATLRVNDPHRRLTPECVAPQKFEKDDDSNFHIDFCTASANMRAMTFDIELSARFDVKHIAGKIIPAIQTTTALVVGYVMIAVYQIIQGRRSCSDYFEGNKACINPQGGMIMEMPPTRALEKNNDEYALAKEYADEMDESLLILPKGALNQTLIRVSDATLTLEAAFDEIKTQLDPEGEYDLSFTELISLSGSKVFGSGAKFRPALKMTTADAFLEFDISGYKLKDDGNASEGYEQLPEWMGPLNMKIEDDDTCTEIFHAPIYIKLR